MAELLKNLFSKKFILLLSENIKESCISFDEKAFFKYIFNESWESFELKKRMRHISIAINEFLPFSYEKQLEILIATKKKLSIDGSYQLQSMVFQDFVELYGLSDYENSIKALEEFTINSSSEFAIRQFILKYEDKTMKQMRIWAENSNEHIRRLASEGCRPRLPWAIALPRFKKDPFKVLEIIEILKNDKSKYVQKSVANSLNDISKDNPLLVIEFVKNNLNKSKDLDWICKHASRTLLKKGDKRVLKLFAYENFSHVKLSNFSYDKKVILGRDFNFSFELKSEKELSNLRIEYVIDYLKSKGTYTKKVFMIAQNNFKIMSKLFRKKHSFKDMTTRKHYMGKHYISILINGELILKKEFVLES